MYKNRRFKTVGVEHIASVELEDSQQQNGHDIEEIHFDIGNLVYSAIYNN